MDISEDTATVMAANKTAYEMAMGDLGSSDIDFSDLRESIDNAVLTLIVQSPYHVLEHISCISSQILDCLDKFC